MRACPVRALRNKIAVGGLIPGAEKFTDTHLVGVVARRHETVAVEIGGRDFGFVQEHAVDRLDLMARDRHHEVQHLVIVAGGFGKRQRPGDHGFAVHRAERLDRRAHDLAAPLRLRRKAGAGIGARRLLAEQRTGDGIKRDAADRPHQRAGNEAGDRRAQPGIDQRGRDRRRDRVGVNRARCEQHGGEGHGEKNSHPTFHARSHAASLIRARPSPRVRKTAKRPSRSTSPSPPCGALDV